MATRIGFYTGKLYDSSVDIKSIKECCQLLNYKEPILENEELIVKKRAELKQRCGNCHGCEEARKDLKQVNDDLSKNIEGKIIKVNSDESYLGKDIKDWCMNNTNDPSAIEIRDKYYSDKVDFKPSDKVYYFIDYMSATQSYKECGSLNMMGHRLIRDSRKSPRKIR